MKKIFITLVLLLSISAQADLADELENLVGYSIIDNKTIQGWYDDEEKDNYALL